MTKTEIEKRLTEYVAEIAAQFATGAAREHSYRPALQRLLAAAIPRATVVNEPARIECGAPDILVRENGSARRPIGYVETKDIGDPDLDGNSAHREQFDRYKAELSNIVFTDYLDFHFYEDGEFVAKCRVAEVAGNRIVPAAPEELERFAGLLRHFADVAPKRIASPSRLAYLMAGKARLLARAVVATLNEDVNLESSIGAQMQAFRQWLVHDLDAESFADVYAQTIVYGMFAARFHDTTPEDFSRAEAATLIPRTNPLLRRLFRDLDEYVDESIVWIIDDLVALFAASDVSAILKDYGKATAQTDPLLHFYEDFLAAYNPALRKQRGVWYTPAPVVRYIVRSVDELLKRDFNLPAGLADASKTRVKVVNDNRARKGDAKFVEREMHRVQILDPALGTGTFIAEVVRNVRSKFVGQEGMWPGYVRDHLIPRLNGFEILMASYAMAHLKLDLLLSESVLTGFTGLTGLEGQKTNPDNLVNPVENSRLRIFLTNSLEEFSEATGTLWAMELSNEAREADFIKRDCPVMVVMGNPPYSGVSSNNGEWITKLLADYKTEPGGKKPLDERKHWLNDDYVKFLRMAQHYIERNGEGIVAFINPHGFLDNPTFRGMRWQLLRAFDEIYILDLHGNAKKKEVAPDGSKDENVFDIMQGVSINIFVKRGKDFNAEAQRRREGVGSVGASVPLARVYHAEVFGERETKYGFLDAHNLANVNYKELQPKAPFYFFVPKDDVGEEQYNKGFRIDELMTIGTSGSVSANDNFNISFAKEEQEHKIDDILNLSEPQWRQKYNRGKDSRDWTYQTARADAKENSSCIRQIAYRPFDDRYTCYTGKSRGLYSSPQQTVMSNFIRGDNVGLCVIKICSRDDDCPVFVTDKITDKTILSSKDNANVFPLYLYSDNMGKVEKTPNLNPEIVGKISASLRLCVKNNPVNPVNPVQKLSPEDIFHYIYAVLHTPSYRSRYREFLKVDFPRIPYPSSAEEFRSLASIGEKLVAVHLLKDPKVRDMFSPYANFPVAGGNVVEFLATKNAEDAKVDGEDESLRSLRQKDNAFRVYINSAQYFDNVPVTAWEFFVGGYQPAQKWLKDRKGRTLTSDDIMHYKAIVAALVETQRLMGELEEGVKQ